MTYHLLYVSEAVIDVIVFTFILKYVDRKIYGECLLMNPFYIAWVNLSWSHCITLVVHSGNLYAEQLVKLLATLSVSEDQKLEKFPVCTLIDSIFFLIWWFLSARPLDLVNISSFRES